MPRLHFFDTPDPADSALYIFGSLSLLPPPLRRQTGRAHPRTGKRNCPAPASALHQYSFWLPENHSESSDGARPDPRRTPTPADSIPSPGGARLLHGTDHCSPSRHVPDNSRRPHP